MQPGPLDTGAHQPVLRTHLGHGTETSKLSESRCYAAQVGLECMILLALASQMLGLEVHATTNIEELLSTREYFMWLTYVFMPCPQIM